MSDPRPASDTDTPVRPRPRGITGALSVYHVGFTVPDLEQAVSFFVDVIGSDLLWRDGPLRDDSGSWMKDHLDVHPRAVVRLAMVRCGPSLNVELLEYQGDPDAASGPAKNSDASGRHLAFYVEDIDAAAAYLRQQPGVTFLAGPTLNEFGPTAGMRFVYFRTPWGMFMELDQVPAHMPYEQAAQGRVAGPAPSWNAGRPGVDEPPDDTARDPVEVADEDSFPASDPPARGGIGPA